LQVGGERWLAVCGRERLSRRLAIKKKWLAVVGKGRAYVKEKGRHFV